MTQQNLKVLCSAGLEPMVAGLLPVLLAAASLPGSAPSYVVPHCLLSPLPFFGHSLLCLFLSLGSNSCVGAQRKPDSLGIPILNQVLC